MVRSVRAQHNNAFIAFLSNFTMIAVFIAVFVLMFTLLGVRSSPLRGDFILYIMSGILIFIVHIQTVAAVSGSGGGANPLHQHAALNTMTAAISSAMGSLYLQLITLGVILGLYHLFWLPLDIFEPIGFLLMVILGWYTGVGVGLLFLAIKPWAPALITTLIMLYRRINMIASGKMFVANALPGFMLAMFDWNPLFHIIDQSRGHMFINYFPRYTSWEYAFWVGTTLAILGLIGLFFGERSKSISWGANT